jgi:tape measure domain-containing protein
MADEKKQKVETSIELEDKVSVSCEKIITYFDKLLEKYNEVNTRLSNGLQIEYYVSGSNKAILNQINEIGKEYSKLATKMKKGIKIEVDETTTENSAKSVGEKISNNVSNSINNAIKKADFIVDTYGQAYSTINQNNLPVVISEKKPSNLPVLWHSGFELGKSYVEDYYKLSNKERLRIMKEQQIYEQNLKLPMVIPNQNKYTYEDFQKEYKGIIAKEFVDKFKNEVDFKTLFDKELRNMYFEIPMKQFYEKSAFDNVLKGALKNDVYDILELKQLNLSSDLYKPKFEPNRKYRTIEGQNKAIERAFKYLDVLIMKEEEKQIIQKRIKDYEEEEKRLKNLSSLGILKEYGKYKIKEKINNIDLGNAFESILNKMFGAFKTIFNPNNIKIAIDSSDAFVKINTRIDKLNEAFNKRNGTSDTTDSLMDYIYKSSQNARVNYYDMATTVAGVGTYSNGVFNNQKEVVSFTELLFKVLRTNGIDSDNSYSSVKQITTAMNRGELKGEQLIMLLKNAPSIINMVTQTLKISQQELEKMAREGKISSRALKDVIFVNSKEISDEFNKIPMTWQDVHTRMSNIMLKTFEPVLLRINELANDKKFIANVDKISKKISELIVKIVDFFVKFINKWESLKNTLILVGITLLELKGILLTFKIANFITEFGGLATQLNITIGGLSLLTTTLGGAAVALGAFSAAIAAVGIIATIDKDAIMDAKRYEEYRYGDMLGEKSGTFLNPKLRGTEKSFYEDRGVEWNNGILTYGDNFEQLHNERIEKLGLSNLYNNNNQYTPYIDEVEKYMQDMISELQKANSSLDITTEDLKYMRDIAERDNINRFTTAEIKVDMQNNNNINNNMDIDGVVSQLAEGIEEAMYVVAEGVY